jgi:N utilization substance protein B
MRRRTRARELALQFLYSLDVRGAEILDDLDDFLRESGASRLARRFATELVHGVVAHEKELDAGIARVALNWTLDRMPPVDRNILRLASFELLHCPEIPVGVALNEAIELGKRYSTANSGAFVNGILDQVKALRPFTAEPAQAPPEHDEQEEEDGRSPAEAAAP